MESSYLSGTPDWLLRSYIKAITLYKSAWIIITIAVMIDTWAFIFVPSVILMAFWCITLLIVTSLDSSEHKNAVSFNLMKKMSSLGRIMKWYRSCYTRDVMEMLSIDLIKNAMGIIDKYYYVYKHSLENCSDTVYKSWVHEEASQGKECGFPFFT